MVNSHLFCLWTTTQYVCMTYNFLMALLSHTNDLSLSSPGYWRRDSNSHLPTWKADYLNQLVDSSIYLNELYCDPDGIRTHITLLKRQVHQTILPRDQISFILKDSQRISSSHWYNSRKTYAVVRGVGFEPTAFHSISFTDWCHSTIVTALPN